MITQGAGGFTRERVYQLEARVAELEEELAAWRERDDFDRRWQRREAELLRLREALAIGTQDRHGYSPTGVRLLLDLLEHAGRIRSKLDLLEACAPGALDRDLQLKNVDVYVCGLRHALARHGLREAVQTVWGKGHMISEADALQIRAALGMAAA